MAYIIAGYGPFATDFTFFCHDKTPYYIEKKIIIVCTKTGFIHVSEKEGKLFLKYGPGLVLTVVDDYVRNVSFHLAAFSPAFLRAVFLKILQCLEIYEKG